MPPRNFAQRKHTAVVASLVQAAETAMTRRGFQAVTMRAIAAQAGCSASTLYQYFTNKEQLLHALMEQHSLAMLQQARAARAAADQPTEKLRLTLQSVGEYMHRNRAVIRLILETMPRVPGDPTTQLPPRARSAWAEFTREDFKVIVAAQRRKLIRQDLKPEIIQAFLRAVTGAMFEEFSAREPALSLPEQQRLIWALVAGGMGVRGS